MTALQKSDLLIALGARFDDRVTGQLSSFAAGAKVIHVDIDRAEFNKVRKADVTLQTNVALALAAFDDANATPLNLDVWWKEIRTWQERYPLAYDAPSEDGPLRPQHVIEAIARAAAPGTIVVGWRWTAPDVGVAVLEVRRARHLGQLGWRGHDGFWRARGHWGQGRST